MAFTLPNFNLLGDVWFSDGTLSPSAGPADLTNLPMQKYIAPKGTWDLTPPWSTGFYLQFHPPVFLRFPRAAPFLGAWPTWTVSCIEVPSGSGQYYRTFWQDIQHEGFPNEYALVVGVQCDAELKAIPPPGGVAVTGIGPDVDDNEQPQDEPPVVLPPGPWTPPVFPNAPLLDTFQDVPGTLIGSHIADTGQTWTVGSGSLEIAGGGIGLIGLDASPNHHFAVVDYQGPPNVPLRLRFETPSSVTNGVWIALLYRGTSATDFWAAAVQWDSVSAWGLSFWQCVGGSFSAAQTGPATYGLVPSTSYLLEVQFSGSIIDATLLESGAIKLHETYTNSANLLDQMVGVWLYVDSNYETCTVREISQ